MEKGDFMDSKQNLIGFLSSTQHHTQLNHENVDFVVRNAIRGIHMNSPLNQKIYSIFFFVQHNNNVSLGITSLFLIPYHNISGEY